MHRWLENRIPGAFSTFSKVTSHDTNSIFAISANSNLFFRSADYGEEEYGDETGAQEEEFKIPIDPTTIKPETEEERNYREMIEA